MHLASFSLTYSVDHNGSVFDFLWLITFEGRVERRRVRRDFRSVKAKQGFTTDVTYLWSVLSSRRETRSATSSLNVSTVKATRTFEVCSTFHVHFPFPSSNDCECALSITFVASCTPSEFCLSRSEGGEVEEVGVESSKLRRERSASA